MSKHILVLGGGVAGAQALKHLQKKFRHEEGYSITVVDKNNYSLFTPMLHEVATGSVGVHSITHPVRGIIPCCVYQGSVKSIDLQTKKVVTDNHAGISYDYLVLALGSTNNYYGIPGAEEYTLCLKTLNDAMRLRKRVIGAFEKASRLPKGPEREAMLHFVIVGGGYTGVETAGQLAELFRKDFKNLYSEITPNEPKVTLVQGGKRILPILSEESSARARARLEDLGVNVQLGHRVASVSEHGATLDNQEKIDSHHIIWASGVKARGAEFFPEDMLEKGRIKVKETLQVHDHQEVFVIGDLAATVSEEGPHPQTAQVAVQQSKHCAENLFRYVHGQNLTSFSYKHKGDLIPIGDRWAIAEIGPLKFTGFIAWWLRRTVYLQGLFSWSDRLRVIIDWTMNLFTKRDTTIL